jgi:hypothetical protein
MPSLTQQRCLNHGFREAVARCPECRRFFCRECITEHEERVLCAACLKKLTRTASRRRFQFANLGVVVQCLLGVLTAWLFFHCVGRALLAMPDSFHEGTVWKSRLMDEE